MSSVAAHYVRSTSQARDALPDAPQRFIREPDPSATVSAKAATPATRRWRLRMAHGLHRLAFVIEPRGIESR